MPISPGSRFVAGLIFVLLPTVELGGLALLTFIRKRIPGYLDNPLRQAFFRAGHAHAGVLCILALAGLFYVDQAILADQTKALVRWMLFAAPLLISAGFFLSVVRPSATKPSGLIALTYLGALSLAAGVLTLGVGLL